MYLPWFPRFRRLKPPSEEDEYLADLLYRYAAMHWKLLHRVDAWLDPETLQVMYKRPRKAAQPLRIGDVLRYDFWFFQPAYHDMVYVGCGYVVHLNFKRHERVSYVFLQHISELKPSQRRRLYSVENGGFSKLHRLHIISRALLSLGMFEFDTVFFNCQHAVECWLGNKPFSIGVIRGVFITITVCLLVLALAHFSSSLHSIRGTCGPGRSKVAN